MWVITSQHVKGRPVAQLEAVERAFRGEALGRDRVQRDYFARVRGKLGEGVTFGHG